MTGLEVWLRRAIRLAQTLVLLALAVLAYAYWEATRDPVIRRADVGVADWPKDAPPVTVLLVTDTHVAGPDMPPARMVRLAEQLSALKPDLILLAGDYISQKRFATRHYAIADTVMPLTHFRAPLGTLAVLGNHDHWAGTAAFRQAFHEAGITLLANEAVRRGPLIVGGLDDSASYHADMARTAQAMEELGEGPRILFTHTPDALRKTKVRVDAMMAGHTHCSQIVLPFYGSPAKGRLGFSWLPCGKVEIGDTPLFVGSGLGTSIAPLRLGAPPDAWLIRFGPRTGPPERLAQKADTP